MRARAGDGSISIAAGMPYVGMAYADFTPPTDGGKDHQLYAAPYYGTHCTPVIGLGPYCTVLALRD
eukprot:746600-Hanusia_phi.AAC.1